MIQHNLWEDSVNNAPRKEKRCPQCGIIKDAGEFGKLKGGRLADYCTSCWHAYQKAYRKAHPRLGSRTGGNPQVDKICARCQATKTSDEFPKYKDGTLRSWCRTCTNAYMRAKDYQRTTEESPEVKRDRHLRHKYGISSAEYDALFLAQGGVCAICGRAETGVGGRHGKTPVQLAVDHNHETGAIRALLCNQCNRGLGCFGDDERQLQVAIDYLRSHRREDT
jgi:hypothetical protein